MMSGSLLRGLRLLPARPAVSRGWGGGASARGRGREAGGTANRPAGPGDGQRVRSGAVRVAPGRTRRVEVGDRPPGGPRELSAAAPSPHPGPGRGGGGVLLVSVPADGGAKSGWDPPQEEERGKGKRSLATLANGLHG